jgi:beta-aspartyl-peptidase (threonine type)
VRIGPFLFLALGACAPDERAIIREVRAVLEDQVAAWNRGDVDGFMAGYDVSDEIVFTSRSKIRRGFETTRDHFRRNFGGRPEKMGRLRFADLEIHPTGADAAWVLGRWRLEGVEGTPGGVFTLVVARRPAGWRVVMDHTSTED